MSETHISYEVSKRLKEFLGDSAPEPINKEYWWEQRGPISGYTPGPRLVHCDMPLSVDTPAYQLHDLLSKPFCEAMASKKVVEKYSPQYLMSSHKIGLTLNSEYFNGGLLAVEKALMEMMEGK